MINKHKRKYFLHIKILKKLKSLKDNERNILLNKCLNSLENSKNKYSTKNEWNFLLKLGQIDFNKFSFIILSKNDNGELLRHTSELGESITEKEREEYLKMWKIFENKWLKV